MGNVAESGTHFAAPTAPSGSSLLFFEPTLRLGHAEAAKATTDDELVRSLARAIANPAGLTRWPSAFDCARSAAARMDRARALVAEVERAERRGASSDAVEIWAAFD